jgi:hyperpolarization activated cyclic nucleotide-gated potassium channel 2
VRLLVLPDGYPKLSWDMLCMVLIFYEILTIPLKISFDLDIPDALERFVDSCFYADILLNFNTAIYFKGNLCYDRWKITIEYLKLWFWLDVASSFPYMEVVDYALLSQET